MGRVRPPMPVSSVTMVGAISSMVYCSMAWRGKLCTWDLACLTLALMACSRSAGSSMSVPKVATMKVMALPVPSSPLGRTDTGMPAVMVWSGRLARASRNWRSAPPHKASTTSFKVQLAASAKARSRAMENCAVAKRRFSRTLPFSTDCGASKGSTMPSSGLPMRRRILPKAVSNWGTDLACSLSTCTAAAVALAIVGDGRVEGSLGSRGWPLAQNGGRVRLLSGSPAIARCSSIMPLTPSISEWCILMNSAKRSPASPSMMVHSHGGRVRSSGELCSRPTSSPSSRSPPGQGRAAWRTWYSRSILSSSTQAGTGFLLKATFSLRFQGALKVRWPRKSAISWRMKSRGACGGRRN